MGFLTKFKKKKDNVLLSKDQAEQVTVEALRRFNETKNQDEIEDKNKQIDRLEEDKTFLQNQLTQCQERIKILESKPTKEQKKSLSKLEKKIYNVYLKHKPKSKEQYFKLLIKNKIEIKETSLNVYISRIRTKGQEIDFDD